MKITLYTHPLAPVAPQVFEAESLAHWLLDHYGEAPRVKVQIFTGPPCAANEISHDLAALLVGAHDEYVVLQSPGGFETIFYIVMVIVAVAAYVLAPKAVMPGNINRTQQSPNNALGDRANKVRMLERIEDIYGTVKSIPSLMMPTYIKYVAHQKYEYGYYCVGRGYYTLAKLSDGDTLLASIPGSSAAVYDPFTSPNSGAPTVQIGAAIADAVVTAARAIEVDGITLKALNQVQLVASGSYTFAAGGVIQQAAKTPNINAVAAPGDTLTVTMGAVPVVSAAGAITADAAAKTFTDSAAAGLFSAVGVGDTLTTAGFVTPANNGVWTVAAKTTSVITVTTAPTSEAATAATVSVNRNYSGTYPVASVTDGAATVTGSAWSTAVTVVCAVQVGSKSEYSAWVTLPKTDRSEVWCNVVALNGLFKDSGGKAETSVAFAIEIEKLDALLVPLGVVETVTGVLTGAVTDERAVTIVRVTAWVGPARVRMRRTTAYDYAFAGTTQDEIKWADLYSVSPVSKTHFGNKTTIQTVTQATARATAVKARQLNCLASRKLPTYNGSAFSGAFDATGRLISGTIAVTSKVCDIIAAVSVDPKIGARDLATEIDMAQIWGVQQQLDAWNAQCGQFNYTFDSDNLSFEETVISIANAGFCIAYRQNGKIRLALDRAQASSTALFTHRNKKPLSETITRKFASDTEYDGIEFVYVEPDNNQSETITLPLSGSYTKLKKFEIAGIRSFTQAWLRANREYQKLIGQRISLETTTTLDARSLLPNSRIDVVDNTRFKSYDGDVVGQSGLELMLSRDVAFTPALPHSIVLMRRDGSLQSIPVTAGSAPNKIILQSLPSESITTVYGPDGIRTIFSFAADSARGAMAWLVQEVDISDGQYVTLRAINYSDGYFAADYAAIPAKASVIN